jgi:2-octaprenyl-6-methoxyphenol hydroxylase
MTQCDVIIGGGGMVGLTLAVALAKGGFKVVVADPVAQSTALEAKFDGRVSALAYASVRMFGALGVWPHLEKDAQPIRDILVTDARLNGEPSPFSLHFDAEEVGADALGHIVENRHIRAGLFAVAATLPNLRLVAPAAMTDLKPSPHGRQWRDGRCDARGRRRRPRFADARAHGSAGGRLVLSAMGHRGDGRA